MIQHHFLFHPTSWLGEGKISLSVSDEVLPFYTRWNLGAKSPEGEISAKQEVQIAGISDVMNNHFLIYDLTPTEFKIELENATLGKIIGKGVIKDTIIAWEFRSEELGFDGFELYERQEDGSYLIRAEYATADACRTTIEGKIWEKVIAS